MSIASGQPIIYTVAGRTVTVVAEVTPGDGYHEPGIFTTVVRVAGRELRLSTPAPALSRGPAAALRALDSLMSTVDIVIEAIEAGASLARGGGDVPVGVVVSPEEARFVNTGHHYSGVLRAMADDAGRTFEETITGGISRALASTRADLREAFYSAASLMATAAVNMPPRTVDPLAIPSAGGFVAAHVPTDTTDTTDTSKES